MSLPDLCLFNCACCKKKSWLWYMKYQSIYHTAQCCMSLVCESCYDQHTHGRKFKCSLCASQTLIVLKKKTGFRFSSEWIGIYRSYYYFYSFVGVKFPYLIPYTQTGEFGTWEDVGDVLSNRFTTFRVHPRFRDFVERYNMFVGNFYTNMFLFHTLRSAPIRSLNFLKVETSPNMLDFFKNLPDMAFFSDQSRKKLLRWGLNGFISFILDKLSINMSESESSASSFILHKKQKFLFMLLRIVLAKKAKSY